MFLQILKDFVTLFGLFLIMALYVVGTMLFAIHLGAVPTILLVVATMCAIYAGFNEWTRHG